MKKEITKDFSERVVEAYINCAVTDEECEKCLCSLVIEGDTLCRILNRYRMRVSDLLTDALIHM